MRSAHDERLRVLRAVAVAFGCAFAVLRADAEEVRRTESRTPYRDFSDAGAGFYGPGREDPRPPGLSSVRIGVFGPAAGLAGQQLRAGVELAIADANSRGGYDGLRYEMVFRADDGAWGMGAQQVTALGYEDSVWAIVGGLEGGGAHVAELVVAKIWVPLVTPTAADLSLDYANVPWVFRCFPSDVGQARALLVHAHDRHYENLFVFTEDDREGRTGWARVRDAANAMRVPVGGHYEYSPHAPRNAAELADLAGVDAVLVWGSSRTGLELLRAVRAAGFAGSLLGPSTLVSPELLADVGQLGDLVLAAPYDLARDDERWRRFRARYETKTGSLPDPVGVFAFDATAIVIDAIEQAGLSRARIRDVLATQRFDAVTGTTCFDSLGGSASQPVLMTHANGAWVKLGVEAKATRTHAADPTLEQHP